MRDVRYSSPALAERIEALREEVQELDLEGVDLDRTFRFVHQPGYEVAERPSCDTTLKLNLHIESDYTLPDGSEEVWQAACGPRAVPVSARPDPGRLGHIDSVRRPDDERCSKTGGDR